MADSRCIVQIEEGVWLTIGPRRVNRYWDAGDPPRTVVKANARVYRNPTEAQHAITLARETHPLKELSYTIIPYVNE